MDKHDSNYFAISCIRELKQPQIQMLMLVLGKVKRMR